MESDLAKEGKGRSDKSEYVGFAVSEKRAGKPGGSEPEVRARSSALYRAPYPPSVDGSPFIPQGFGKDKGPIKKIQQKKIYQLDPQKNTV